MTTTPSPSPSPHAAGLEPCPFCGCEARETHHPDPDLHTKNLWFVACECRGAHQFGETQEEVRAKWNTRTQPPEPPPSHSVIRNAFMAGMELGRGGDFKIGYIEAADAYIASLKDPR